MIEDNNVLNQYKESKRIIRQAMKEHQLVLFVGAGASIASGMPTWPQAVKKIADRLSIGDKQLDYLRIPQNYYNSRGKKEYTQLMRNIFKHGRLLPKHKIHDKIIDFNVDTIITTNYDHLIEQAAEDHSEIRMVVSKDADLPYRRGGKELIKMHGDFENDNFVLKEDDFLSYSRNFKLIENYIKSLIGTKVVLFLGYSFNDPDLKLIFSWVKDILDGDFQRAYLIESGKPYDVNEAEYFRNFGINLLYASIQMQNDFDSNNLTDNLLYMLEWLLSSDRKDKLTILYDELKPYSKLQYVAQNYIRNALFKVGINSDNGCLSVHDFRENSFSDEESISVYKSIAYVAWNNAGKSVDLSDIQIKRLFDCDEEGKKQQLISDNNQRLVQYFNDFNIQEKDKGEIECIYDILCHSNLYCMRMNVKLDDSNPSFYSAFIPFPYYKNNCLLDAVDHFNYTSLIEMSKNNCLCLTETEPDLFMEQGYIQFILGDYATSYNCYKRAKKTYYKKGDFFNYFIAEFNSYILGKMITQSNYMLMSGNNISIDYVDIIGKEVQEINLNKLYNVFGDSNKALEDLYTFNVAYTLFQDTYKLSMKVSEQAKTNYTFFAGTTAFSGMRERVWDYYNYITINLLPVNKCTEHISIFRVYFQSIVGSVMAMDNNEVAKNTLTPIKNIRPKALVEFDILVALKFIELKDLEKLLRDLPYKLPLSEDALEYLNIVITNCIQDRTSKDVFWKCVTILGNCNLTHSIVETTFKKLITLIVPYDFINSGRCIVKFLNNIYSEQVLETNVITDIKKLLEHVLSFIISIKDENIYYRDSVLTMLWILKENNGAFDEPKYISSLTSSSTQMLCVLMYPFLGETSQKIIVDYYRDWKFESTNFGFELYYELVEKRIVSPCDEIERQILEYYTKENTDLSLSESMDINMFPLHNDDDFLYQLLNLYLEDLIVNRELVRELIHSRNIQGADWLMNWKDYDYDSFDICWLEKCTDKFIDEICSSDDSVKKKIKLKIEKEYNNRKVSPKILDIYFKHFISE